MSITSRGIPARHIFVNQFVIVKLCNKGKGWPTSQGKANALRIIFSESQAMRGNTKFCFAHLYYYTILKHILVGEKLSSRRLLGSELI
jgi:hypothetical protein